MATERCTGHDFGLIELDVVIGVGNKLQARIWKHRSELLCNARVQKRVVLTENDPHRPS
jgi:hypothetical protein